MAEKIGEAIISRLTNEAADSIWRQIGYVYNYKSNIHDLKNQLNKCRKERQSLQHSVDEAKSNGELIEHIVTNWFQNMDDAIIVAENIIADHENANRRSCFIGCCPNLRTRHQFSRKAKKHIPIFAQVQAERSSIDRISYLMDVQELELPIDYEAFESRTDVLNETVRALKNVDFNLIGVFGMSGVGKTTLATQHLINEVKRDGIFKVVTWAKVTQTPDLKIIQEEIAAWLGLKFDVDSTQVRAVRLCARLKQEERVLVILDDIWSRIKLEEIGIPIDENSRGCKILMTSRYRNVLLAMGVQKYFSLKVLQNEEAWKLFQKKLGNKTIDSNLQPIAFEVSKRCAGLPGLITAVATALRNQDLREWRDSLERLKRFDHEEIDGQVNSALELSYNYLRHDARPLFLLCAQIGPNNINVNYLLKYGLGLGIFRSCNTVEAARNRLHSLVNDLKASCWLLEAGNKDEVLQMHDLVHNFAIKVASKDQPVISDDRMSNWQEDDTLENCTALLLNDGKVSQLPGVFNCPKLKLLLLNCVDFSLEDGDNFFGGMKGLRVLNLKNLCLSSLPSSLECLRELQTLCLDCCDSEDISVIGELKKLQVLSLISCSIVRFPRELEKLTNLQLLELKDCLRLEVIEPDTLSRLTQLQELHMENSFMKWDDSEGNNGQLENANLIELEHLSKLVILHMHVMDAKMLPHYLQLVKQLEDFKILIGEEWDWNVEYKTSRTLKLKLNTSDHVERVKGFLMRTEDLHLDDLKGVENVLDTLDEEGFPHLKHLVIQNSQDIQYIINWRWLGHVNAFHSLESLSLNKLNKLEMICSGPLKMGSFGSLRRLKVWNCSMLRNLFPFSIFRGLKQLDEVDVSSCKVMKMIVDDDGGQEVAIKLDKLQTLTLDHLPQFASFCSQERLQTISRRGCAEIISEDEIEIPLALFSKKIDFPNLVNIMLTSITVENIWSKQLRDVSPCTQNLTSLIVHGCGNLRYIFTSSIVQRVAQLKKLEISDCNSMREIILTEGLDEEMMTTRKILFPKLDLLKLKHLPALESFCSGKLLECPLLKVLRVENCLYLKVFVSSSIQTDVGVNSGGSQPNMTLFDEKVSFPELEELQILHMHRLRMIWKNEYIAAGSFDKLKELKVEHAKEVSQLFPSNMLVGALRNLETLFLKNCDLMEQVFDMEGAMQENGRLVLALRTLNIQDMPMLKRIWSGDAEGPSWNNLRTVTAHFCPSLKSLLPSSIATSLLQLEKLDIVECKILEELVWGRQLETSPVFFFPKLQFIQLFKLYELRNFYPKAHTFKCPILETLWVHECPKLELFSLDDSPNLQETHVGSKIEVQLLFSSAQLLPNLKKMTLNFKEAMMIQKSNLSTRIFHRLEVLQLLHFKDGSSCLEFDPLRRFQKLQNLYLGSSDFEELFPHGLAGDDQNVAILMQIRSLKFNFLPKLKRIWNQGSHHKQVFQNLETLYVYACDGLISLVPSFASFKNLQTLEVNKCDGLMNLFESTTAKTLVHLRSMTIKNCNMVTEIVATGANEIQTEIALVKLESLKLHCLKSLICFSIANCPIKFPSLTEVIVTQCPNMKFFSGGNMYAPKLKKVYVTEDNEKWRWVGDLNSTIKQLYAEMAGIEGMQQLELSEFPNLKEKWFAQSLPVNFFYNLTSLVVDNCANLSIAIPSNLLPFLIALEKLEIRNCDSLQKLFDFEWSTADRSFGYLSNLKELRLIDLPQLSHVWDEIPIDMFHVTSLKFKNCGSLRNILTPTMCLGLVRLKSLKVTNCRNVEEIISPPASTNRTISPTIAFALLERVVFKDLPNLTDFYSGAGSVECPCLKEITIAGCPQLNITHTIVESKVSSLSHLKDLPSLVQTIWNCQSLTSLMIGGLKNLKFLFTSSVAKSLVHLEKVEISNCGVLEQVIAMEGQEEQIMRLQKIEFLKLKDLPKLTQFSACDMLECPSLKELQIQSCPQLMEFVSDSSRLNVAPKNELQIITSTLFNEKVAFPNLERMEVIKMDNLRMIWSNNLHSDSFGKLEVLKVEYGRQLMEIFPHNILARLQNLKDLVIKNCDLLEKVFDIHGVTDAKEMESVTSQLQTSDIRNMLNLRYVWNEDPKGVVSLDKLSSVYVWECPNLKSLFPFSIAKSLQQLEDLDLNSCGLVELVAKETRAVEEAPKFVFPRLKYLELWYLEKLEYFFREIHTLDCPVLERLSVLQCENLAVFSEDQVDTEIQKSLFSFTKIISDLKYLSFTSKDAMMIKERNLPPQVFDKVNVVELHCFDSELEASPSNLLKLFHNIEKLYVRFGTLKELFPRHGMEQALESLKLLKVEFCDNLISLAPFTVSFENLTDLDIHSCDGLVSLMGLGTARSLVRLQTMRIRNCDELPEIVSNEGSDDESKVGIIFTKLHSLELNDLPSLVSFCPAECSFEFPSMTRVIICGCPKIKFFSKQVSPTPELKRVQVSETDEGHWNGNLNATVQRLFTDQSVTVNVNSNLVMRGLPSLIAAVAIALRNKEAYEWMDLLNQMNPFEKLQLDVQINLIIQY